MYSLDAPFESDDEYAEFLTNLYASWRPAEGLPGATSRA
jgi:hypothetical protein